jgi:ribosome assembly protein RRB1
MLRPHLHPKTDVNVLSWNNLVSNLLATGGDDGTLCVWDLRHFGGDGGSGKSSTAPKPLARFSCHRTPVTSVEWHPTDESMLTMSDEVGVYIYDLSVEEDIQTSTSTTQLVADIPPQLLFCHSGSQQFKECHWHPQISSCVMTTAYTGFSVFIPSNL